MSGVAVVVVVEVEALVAVVAVDDDDAVVGVVEAGVVAWVPDTITVSSRSVSLRWSVGLGTSLLALPKSLEKAISWLTLALKSNNVY